VRHQRRESRLRALVLGLLFAVGTALAILLARERPVTPLRSSLATPFQLLGAPVKLADRLASRIVPVGSVEERDLGDLYRRRFEAQVPAGDADQAYLDRLMAPLRPFARRPFPYRAFRAGPLGGPNALALPGGVILVSDELLTDLGSEAELVAVLAHEIGHIELGHCFDAVRFQLLGRRSGSESLGTLADLTRGLLVRHSFSKAEEHEADAYAFTLLASSRYDPAALGSAFASLQRAEEEASSGGRGEGADPLRDYVSSHPPLPLRREEFRQEAAAWWRRHPHERRYLGVANLRRRQALDSLALPGEWRQGAKG
jgi:Zn-dependent protease with chaperone function